MSKETKKAYEEFGKNLANVKKDDYRANDG